MKFLSSESNMNLIVLLIMPRRDDFAFTADNGFVIGPPNNQRRIWACGVLS
jgi:hypothetical protein